MELKHHIPLSEFEHHIRAEVVSHALDLHEAGKVDMMHHLGNGKVEAVVHEGRDAYHASLQVQEGNMRTCDCDCGTCVDAPCRHVVALVFQITLSDFREGVVTRSGHAPEEVPKPKRGRPPLGEKKNPPTKPEKAAKRPAGLAGVLWDVPKEDLLQFIVEMAKADKAFDAKVKAHWQDLLPLDSPAELIKRIKESFDAIGKVKNKLLKAQTQQAAASFEKWCAEGIRYVALGDMPMATTCYREVALWASKVLDSAGFSYEQHLAISKAIGKFLQEMIELTKDKPERKGVLDLLPTLADLIKDKDGQDLLVSAYIEACVPGPDAKVIDAYLNSRIVNASQYAIGAEFRMILRCFKLSGDQKREQEFREKHAKHPFFVTQEVMRLCGIGQYDAAMAIIRSGQSKDSAKFYRTLAEPEYWTKLIDIVYAAQGLLDQRLINLVSPAAVNSIIVVSSQRHEITLWSSVVESVTKDEWAAARAKLLPNWIHSGDHNELRGVFLLNLFHPDWPELRQALEHLQINQLGKALYDFPSDLRYDPKFSMVSKSYLALKNSLAEWLLVKAEAVVRERTPLSTNGWKTWTWALQDILNHQVAQSLLSRWKKDYPDYVHLQNA